MTTIYDNLERYDEYTRAGILARKDLENLRVYNHRALSTISNYKLGLLQRTALCQYQWLTPEILNSLVSVWYKHDFSHSKMQYVIDGWADTSSYIRDIHSRTIKRQYRKDLYEEQYEQFRKHYRGLSNEHYAPSGK